jgi:hypothetical protein
MAKFPSDLLSLVAAGDTEAQRKLVDRVTFQCRKLARWHLASWDLPSTAGMADGVVRRAAYRFIRELLAHGVPDNPDERWLRQLVRALFELRAYHVATTVTS